MSRAHSPSLPPLPAAVRRRPALLPLPTSAIWPSGCASAAIGWSQAPRKNARDFLSFIALRSTAGPVLSPLPIAASCSPACAPAAAAVRWDLALLVGAGGCSASGSSSCGAANVVVRSPRKHSTHSLVLPTLPPLSSGCDRPHPPFPLPPSLIQRIRPFTFVPSQPPIHSTLTRAMSQPTRSHKRPIDGPADQAQPAAQRARLDSEPAADVESTIPTAAAAVVPPLFPCAEMRRRLRRIRLFLLVAQEYAARRLHVSRVV
jgi:hypothetical protein